MAVPGKVIDVVVVLVAVAVFLLVAIVVGGPVTAIVAVFGLTGLGYYNSYIRHDPALVARQAETSHGRKVDCAQTLRPAWRPTASLDQR